MINIEPFEMVSVVNGTVWLDGGAMFGVVPKVMWEKVTEVDSANRIPLATRTLIAVDRAHERVILVDTGCGTKWEPEKAARFAINFDPEAIPTALASLSLGVEDVTDVVISHLHFDHNGGVSRWFDDPGGKTELCYPQARHWVHKTHWEHALRASKKDRASFLRQDFEVLAESEMLRFVEGDAPAPPFEGVDWFVSRGHTPCQLHPIFGTGHERVMFIGDLVPTVGHLPLAWVMAYDLEPLRTISEREAVYQRSLEEGMALAFPHDPKIGAVKLGGTVDRPIVESTLLS